MENVDFLQKPVELAKSCQHSIGRLGSISVEIAKFYVPLTATFSPFFNILFSFIYQQMLFNETISKLTLTRFTILFPYNLWADQPRQLEEEIPAEIEQPNAPSLPNFLIAKQLRPNLIADYSALATAKSNVSFLSNLLLAKNLTPNLVAALAEQPSIHVPTRGMTPLLEPALSQAFESTKLVTTSLQEPRMKKAARPEEKYSPPATGLSRAWFLPSFLLAQRITSDVAAALIEQPYQKITSGVAAALAEQPYNLTQAQVIPVGPERVAKKEKPLPEQPSQLAQAQVIPVDPERVAKKEKPLLEQPYQSALPQKATPFLKSETAESLIEKERPTELALPQKATPLLKSEDTEKMVKKEKPVESALTQATPPLLKSETSEEAVIEQEPLEETSEIAFLKHIVKWQSELASRISPSLKSLASFMQHEKTAYPLVLSVAMSETSISRFAGLRTLESSEAAFTQEKATAENNLAEPSEAIVFKATSPPSKEPSRIDVTPIGLTVGAKLGEKSLSSFAYATALPTLILEKETPFLRIASAISLASSLPLVTAAPIIEPSSSYTAASQMTVPVTQSQMKVLTKEIFPSLTSWIYEGSELLRSTGVPLSAVPIAASTAERIVNETLIQPMSSFGTAKPHDYEEPATEEQKLTRLPTLLVLAGAGSLITHRLQRELTAFTKETQTLRSIPQISARGTEGVAPAKAFGAASVSELANAIATEFLTAATAIPASQTAIEATRRAAGARASQAALIAGSVAAVTELAAGLAAGASYRAVAAQASKAALLEGSAAAMAEISAGILVAPYFKGTSEISARAITGATARASRAATAALVASNVAAISELAAGASAEAAVGTSAMAAARAISEAALTQSQPAATYIPSTPPVSQLPPKPPSGAPIAQNNLNFVPDETVDEEEDLRDLERKIRKILSEQISRYYGSSMI